jgi:hypothetical protein
MFDNLMDDTPSSSLVSDDDELQHYLAMDVEDMKDGLMWWHVRCKMFPCLSRMACDYLAIPCEYMIFLHLCEVLNPKSHSLNCWRWMHIQLWVAYPSTCLWPPCSRVHTCVYLCWSMERWGFSTRWWYQSISWSRRDSGGGWTPNGLGYHPHIIVS